MDGLIGYLSEVEQLDGVLSEQEQLNGLLSLPIFTGGGLTDEIKDALLDCFAHVAWIDGDGRQYYDALQEALYPLSSITAVYTQSGTVYTDASLDSLKDDLVVTAHYGTSHSETVTTYTLSGTLTVGTSIITVTYEGKTTTFNVTVSEEATLSSISAVYTQSGTVYPSDSLDSLKSDLVVTAHYSDTTTATVASSDYTLSGTLTAGTSTVTVSYGGKTTTFSVTVSAPATLESITAVYTQSGTVYDTDSLDSLKADLVVTAVYTDSSTEVVPSADYTLSGTLTVGTSTITVSYEGKTATFSVTVSVAPLWTFVDHHSLSKGQSSVQAGKVYVSSTNARACGDEPIVNNNYVFTVTDATKYNLAAYDITDNTPIEYGSSVTGYMYQAGTKSISWKTSDSVSTPYVWLSLKKLNNTAFTAAELANGAEAVFTYTTT